MTTVHLVAGARPNFMKVAPLYHALRHTDWAQPILIHTGQHSSPNMSDLFIDELGLPQPHHRLRTSANSLGRQVGQILIAYEDLLVTSRPDWVIVVGDVDSTLASALAATKLGIPTAHLEAGLRSFDRTMPEETNRVVTDAICDLLWTPSPDADENLDREGIPASRVERVGNIMIDCLEMLRPRFQSAKTSHRLGFAGKNYGVITIHRPSNVDHQERLCELLNAIEATTRFLPLLFPIHPRTRMRLVEFGLTSRLESSGVQIVEPLGYIDFMNLVINAAAVITDSGGLQEETTYLGVPCFTLRDNTERPITITQGTNQLTQLGDLAARVSAALSSAPTQLPSPDLWDGRTAGRVVESLARHNNTI